MIGGFWDGAMGFVSKSTDRKIVVRSVVMSIVIVGLGLIVASGGVVADNSADLEDLDGNGSEGEPYVITNVSELQAMEDNLEAHYELAENIDASVTEKWGDEGFKPIGDDDDHFEGTFDGNDRTIANLTIDQDETFVGLFGTIGSKSVVSNLTLDSANITGSEQVGGLSGANYGEVSNISASTTVSGDIVGGLAGNNRGKISNVNVTTTVTSKRFGGGIVGPNENEGSITNTTAAGTVFSENSEEEEGGGVGGIAGVHSYSSIDSSSFTSGTVDGNEQPTGGIAGFVDGSSITNSNANGTVGNEDADRVGGLVGDAMGVELSDSYANASVRGNEEVGGVIGNGWHGHVERTYAAGEVDGDGDDIGGLVGKSENFDPDLDLDNSYWDVETTNQSDSAGSDSETYGLTTNQMTGLNATEEMTGFEFPVDGDGTWHVTHDYPVLEGQNSDGLFEVTLTDTNAPVEEGDTLEVTATVSNWGASDEQPVTLTSDSTESDETTAALDSGQSDKSVTLTWETESGDAGDQPLTVSSPDNTDSESVTIDTASSSSSSSSPSSPTPDPADISVTDATLNDSQIEVNGSVAVNATLENDGDETGTESVTFRASGDEFANEGVRIDGESDQTISVVETFDEAGEYEITADDEDTSNLSVTELETPEFEIIFVDASYGILEPGHEEHVIVTVANDGDAAGDAEVVLDFDGEESSETLELDAGRGDDAEFWLTAPDEVGEHEYNISVGDEETTETMIVEARDPEWNIDDFSFSPETVEPGEDVDMATTVENTGGVGTISVDFYIDDEAADSQDVDVDGGHSETVEATLIAPEDDGRYEIGVTLSDSDETYDGSEGEIVVGNVSEVDEDESPEENDDDELDDGQPGFGVLATFASIIFLILTRSRRQR